MTGTSASAQWRAKQIAAGAKIVDGWVSWEPRVKRRPGEEPPHGTHARYRWRQDPCRCPGCSWANRMRSRREAEVARSRRQV